MMTFKEFLLEGKFPGAPKRMKEKRADAQGVKVRAKRDPKNLPDERVTYHPNKDMAGKRSYKGKQWEKHL